MKTYNFEFSDVEAYNLFKAVNSELTIPVSYIDFFDEILINFCHDDRIALTVDQVLRIFK